MMMIMSGNLPKINKAGILNSTAVIAYRLPSQNKKVNQNKIKLWSVLICANGQR